MADDDLQNEYVGADTVNQIRHGDMHKVIERAEILTQSLIPHKCPDWNPLSYCFNWGLSGTVLLNTVTMEATMAVVLAIASTSFFNFYVPPDGLKMAAKLDFSLVSAAVVFPVSFLIATTFNRRERALIALTDFKASVSQVAMAYATWGFAEGHRKNLPSDFTNETLHDLIALVYLLQTQLQLPTRVSARNVFTAKGFKRFSAILETERRLRGESTKVFFKLHEKTGQIKAAGITGGEASRISQYNLFLHRHYENLCAIKAYRTPQVTRSFLRFFVLVIPILYGPYYSWVIGNVGSANTTFAFATVLSIFMAWVLASLVSIQRSLEDPFLPNWVDTIHVSEEMADVVNQLRYVMKYSPDNSVGTVPSPADFGGPRTFVAEHHLSNVFSSAKRARIDEDLNLMSPSEGLDEEEAREVHKSSSTGVQVSKLRSTHSIEKEALDSIQEDAAHTVKQDMAQV